MKGFTWGLIGLGYGCDSRVCSWEVFEDMPLGVLKWRGGLRGVSSECCEPVNGVARKLKCRLWEQRRSRDLRLQWKWWLAHWLRPLKLQKEMEVRCVRQTGHFCNSIWCLYFRLYTKGGRNSTFKVTHFDKIWHNREIVKFWVKRNHFWFRKSSKVTKLNQIVHLTHYNLGLTCFRQKRLPSQKPASRNLALEKVSNKNLRTWKLT